MSNEKYFKVAILGTNQSVDIPKTISLQIENTGSSGVVSVTNLDDSGNPITFYIQAGQTQMLSGTWLQREVTVQTDGSSTAQIVYWT